MANATHQEIVSELQRFAAKADNLFSLQEHCVSLIAALPRYDWVGFYMLDPGDENFLVLGPFRGAPTQHTRISVTTGICGAAVAQDDTVIVDDVSTDPRYLACSLETRSEIVVPIRANGKVTGEIDVDSHELSAFSPGEREFLEKCATIIGSFIERNQIVVSK